MPSELKIDLENIDDKILLEDLYFNRVETLGSVIIRVEFLKEFLVQPVQLTCTTL